MRRVLSESVRDTAQIQNIPLPINGWNTRDPISTMKPTFALILDNILPKERGLDFREGSELYAFLSEDTTLSPQNIRTLITYSKPGESEQLFAATEQGIWEVSEGGDVSATAADITTTNGEWQYTNITTAGGSFLFLCNGTDPCLLYDGTVFTELGTASTPALTGITSTDVINVSLHKRRLFLAKKDSLSLYYLPVNSIAGEASEYPLGPIFSKGGSIVATASWTIDSGKGSDDYLAIITTKGEVAIYEGIDPASADTWALVGVYQIGEPIGLRCFLKYGGDLAVLTTMGLLLLSKALTAADVNAEIASSNPIVGAWLESAELRKSYFGWQCVLFPASSLLLINVPVTTNLAQNVIYSEQFVMNTISGAWARLTGMHAECWAIFNNNLFFARHNTVFQAFTGQNDAGIPITYRMATAFSALGTLSEKHVKQIRTIFSTAGDVSVQLGVDVDYAQTSSASIAEVSLTGQSLWDSARFDQSTWAGELLINRWESIAHFPGSVLSFRLQIIGTDVSLSLLAMQGLIEHCQSVPL